MMDDQDRQDIDTGEPVTEIMSLRETPTSTFGNRIQNGIQRRIFAADTLDFSVLSVFRVFLDYLTIPFQVLGGLSRDKEQG